MPSVRTLKLEEAKRERLDRLERARKYGMAMGVKSAQEYKQRQQQIESSLNDEIRRKLEAKQASEEADKENVQAQNSLLRGEGLRSAQEHVAVLAARAHEENEAWRSERALTSVRAHIAGNIKHVERSGAMTKQMDITAAREKARRMEVERSQRVLAVSKAASSASGSGSTFLGVADLSSKDGVGSSSRGVVVVRPDTSKCQSSEVVAAAVIESKKREEEEKRQLAAERRQEAVDRAKQIMAEKRAAEEKARAVAEEEKMLRKSMVEQSMRTLKDQPSYDFQEQDARRAMHNATRARKEFEEVFLSGPWSLEQIKKFHVAPKESTDINNAQQQRSSLSGGGGGSIDTSSSLFSFGNGGPSSSSQQAAVADFFAPTSSQQLLQGTPVIGLTTDHLYAKLLLPVQEEAVGDDEQLSGGPEPAYGAPMPTPSGSSAPTGEGSRSPTGDLTGTSIHSGSLPGLPPLGPSSLNVSQSYLHDQTATSNNEDAVDEEEQEALQARNAQFLQELAVFHRRLKDAQRMTQSIRERSEHEDDDEDDEKSEDEKVTTYRNEAGDLSVSPMSTPERRRDYPESPPASRGISPPKAKEANSGSAFKVVMTSEQLRGAIRKMKAFHQQLDMSGTSSEAPTSSEQPSSIPHLRF